MKEVNLPPIIDFLSGNVVVTDELFEKMLLKSFFIKYLKETNAYEKYIHARKTIKKEMPWAGMKKCRPYLYFFYSFDFNKSEEGFEYWIKLDSQWCLMFKNLLTDEQFCKWHKTMWTYDD